MVVTIVCRDTIVWRDTIVLCNRAQGCTDWRTNRQPGNIMPQAPLGRGTTTYRMSHKKKNSAMADRNFKRNAFPPSTRVRGHTTLPKSNPLGMTHNNMLCITALHVMYYRVWILVCDWSTFTLVFDPSPVNSPRFLWVYILTPIVYISVGWPRGLTLQQPVSYATTAFTNPPVMSRSWQGYPPGTPRLPWRRTDLCAPEVSPSLQPT